MPTVEARGISSASEIITRSPVVGSGRPRDDGIPLAVLEHPTIPSRWGQVVDDDVDDLASELREAALVLGEEDGFGRPLWVDVASTRT
jgi:hypothetical protein